MSESRDYLLCDKDFIALIAVLAGGKTGFRTCGRFCRVLNFTVSGCGDNLLMKENFVADCALFTFRKSRFRACGFLAGNGNGGVLACRNFSRLNMFGIVFTHSVLCAAVRAACAAVNYPLAPLVSGRINGYLDIRRVVALCACVVCIPADVCACRRFRVVVNKFVTGCSLRLCFS